MLHRTSPSVRPFILRFLPSRGLISRLLPWLVGFAAFVVYAYTAAPGIVTFFDDTLEFQIVAPTFGIAHPTGYPLYTLLGGVWTRLLPIGTWAGRLNLFSALCAAATVGLVAAISSRLVTNHAGASNPWAGVIAAVTFALGPVWWNQATVAEVYPLHALFVAAILATTIGINQARNFDRRMTLLMLLFGLSLAHHRTTVLLGPAVALYLLWSVPGVWRPRRVWWLWATALLLPLLLYFYIPLRAAAGVRDLNGSYVPGWDGFWSHVLASEYNKFFIFTLPPLTTAQWFQLTLEQMGWIALLLAALGLAWLLDRHWRPARAWWLVLVTLIANLLFAALYRVYDPEVFWLPVLLCLAIFSGGGVGLIMRLLPNFSAPLFAMLLSVLLIVMPVGRGPMVNLRHNWTAHDQARRMAQANFPPQSQVIGLEGEMSALLYMQAAEALGTNATLITANDPAQRRALVESMVAEGLPVYLTREVEGIENIYSFSGDADLVRVWPRGQSQVEPVEPRSPLRIPLRIDNGRVQIESYALRPIAGLAQPAQELTLYWRVLSSTDKVLKLSLRLLDATGTPYQWPDGRAAIEDRFPLHQVALTPDWLPGELLQDIHTVQLPPTLQVDALQGKSSILLVIIYDNATSMEEGRIEIMF